MSEAAVEQAQEPPRSWAQLKTQHRNTVQSTVITLRADLLDQVQRLERELIEARMEDERSNRVARAPQIAEQIRAVEEEARQSEVTFAFQALSRGDFALLQAKHPPTKEQREEFDNPEFNPVTYPPALMAATCIEPAELAGNLAEWEQIHTGWSEGQVMRIWGTCVTANAAVAHTPKSELASEVLRQASSGSN